MPVVAIAPNDALLEKLKSNLQEVARAAASSTSSPMLDSHIASSEGIHVLRLPEHAGLPVADRAHDPAAAARVSHRRAARHGRRQAAQSREVRDGRGEAARPVSTARHSGAGHRAWPRQSRSAGSDREDGIDHRSGALARNVVSPRLATRRYHEPVLQESGGRSRGRRQARRRRAAHRAGARPCAAIDVSRSSRRRRAQQKCGSCWS